MGRRHGDFVRSSKEAMMGATTHTPMPPTAVTDGGRITAESDVARDLIERARNPGPVIREHMDQAEHDRRLSKAVHEGLIAAGLQRILTPRSLGGWEADPVTCARVVEELSGFDAA